MATDIKIGNKRQRVIPAVSVSGVTTDVPAFSVIAARWRAGCDLTASDEERWYGLVYLPVRRDRERRRWRNLALQTLTRRDILSAVFIYPRHGEKLFCYS